MERIAQVLEMRRPLVVEDHLQIQETEQYFITTLFPLFDVSGQIRSIGSIGVDITQIKQAEAALAESELKLRSITEQSADAIILTDETGRLTEWNPAAERVLGLKRAEAMGAMVWDNLFRISPADQQTPERYEQLKTQWLTYFQTGQHPSLNQTFELEIQHPDGTRRMVQPARFSIKTEHGYLLSAVIRDVTERHRLEAALQESQERLAFVVAGADLGTWDWHLPSGQTVFNERWAEMLGYHLAELEPHVNTWEKLVHPDDLEKVNEALQPHLAGQTPLYQTEHRMRTRSGEWKWILDTGKVLIRDEQGQPVRAAGIHQDITQRKEVEESLHRYQQMVAISQDWMLLVDRNYVYRIVNPAYLTLMNKPAEQIVGCSVAEFFGDAVFTTVIKPRLDRGLAGERVQYQEWFDFPVIGRRFMDVTHTPYREADGTVFGVLVSGRDVTEAKLLEEHLQQVQKMGVIGQLAAGMAHHYNSMLTAIIGFTSLSLRTLPPGDPIARNLERVLHTAERMAVLVRQLLAFAQKQLLQFKTAPLNDLVIQLQYQLKQAAPTPIEFALDLAPEVGQVKVDPRQFEYLLLALVSNARDAMPDGGRLTLTTTHVSLGEVEAGWYDLTPGDYVLLTVKDTGIGLTNEVKAHLFEPFFTTKDVGEGTGLGLAMSLGIAKQHGGHLRAESQPGQGTTFILYLPCLAPPPPSLPPVQPTAAGTILLIEAEPIVREFAAEVLSDQGYTVLKATNGEVALQRMTSQPEVSVQLLLTPTHSNSPALVEQLKANSPGLKVILLIDELEELPPERVDFLLKPFTPSGLVQKVRAVLETAPE